MRGRGGAAVQSRVLISVLIALLLYFGSQTLVALRDSTLLAEQKAQLEAEIHTKQRRLDQQHMVISTKERDIFRLEKRLAELESGVKSHPRRSAAKSATIYCVTPTARKPTQLADLTRLSHTLMHVPQLFWIVVEDADSPSKPLAQLLTRSRLPHAHLSALTPADFKLNSSDPRWRKARGVIQRNAALRWIRCALHKTNLRGSQRGAVYFADDDNSYDLRLFEEMRSINRVGVWPVALVGGLLIERPILDESGRIISWVSAWKQQRPFPFDMAAFAVNISLILQFPAAQFSYELPIGFQESHLLQGLGVTLEQLEAKADRCTRVYVWHTRTEAAELKNELKYRRNMGEASDAGISI